MSLAPPPKVRKLQEASHAKAKGSPDYRFYSLYDKAYRRDVLEWAYVRCRANDGAPGVDRRTFEEVEAYGLDRWLDELAADLKAKSYRPLPVRRVFIPKGDGKRRPLGIGTIRDRVAQMAVVLVLEPIFEADLEPERYAYRADRSALDAVQAVHGLVATGHTEVVDADLSGRLRWKRSTGGAAAIERPAAGTRAGAPRKGPRSHRRFPTCTCAVSSAVGRPWGTNAGCKPTSSTTPTTS